MPKPFAGIALMRLGEPPPHDAVTEPPITITDAVLVAGGGGGSACGAWGLVVVVVVGVDRGSGVDGPAPFCEPPPVDVPAPRPMPGATPVFVAFGPPDPGCAGSGDAAPELEVSDPAPRFAAVPSWRVARRAARMEESPITDVWSVTRAAT